MLREELNTIDRLRADNNSPDVEENLKRWHLMRTAKRLPVVWACSDARLVLPKMAFIIRTISASGRRRNWEEALNYENAAGIMLIPHFNCGGLNARSNLDTDGTQATTDEVSGFICDHIRYSDVIYHTIHRGSLTAGRTHKLVLAAVEDHFTGNIYVQGVFNNGQQVEYKTVPSYKLMSGYKDEDLPLTGIPQLASELIPEVFMQALNDVSQQSGALQLKYPDFARRQEVQNPEYVVLTTNVKPLSIRFPLEMGEPGKAFQVSLRRLSLEQEAGLEDLSVAEGIKQINYPHLHCLYSQKEDTGGFKNTRVLYIETGNMCTSAALAQKVKSRAWICEWLELPEREIIIAEVISGKIKCIDRVA